MPIPTQTEAFKVTLDLLSDGKACTRTQLFEKARHELSLTEAECAEKLSSGTVKYKSRLDWGISCLYRNGLIDRIYRGVYQINSRGLALAASNMNEAEVSRWLERESMELPQSRKAARESAPGPRAPSSADDGDPRERLDMLIGDCNRALSDELIQLILEREPAFFEQLAVDLLEKMGYGHGATTRHAADGGIDGVITADALGFDPIYTQTKRYSPEYVVRAPEVRAFAGALNGVSRGVFITTSSFTAAAVDFAKNYRHATIVLIDGARLTELMIKHNVGVSTDVVYEAKKVNVDYFEG